MAVTPTWSQGSVPCDAVERDEIHIFGYARQLSAMLIRIKRAVRITSRELVAPLVPFRMVRPFLRNRLTSLFGHNVCDQPAPFTRHLYHHPTIAGFERMLDLLSEHFTFVSLADAWANARGEFKLPSHPLFLSFDDGHREMLEVVAPILERRNIPAAFFVTTAAIDNRFLFWPHKKSYLIATLNNEVQEKVADEVLPQLGSILDIIGAPTRDTIRQALQKLHVQDPEAKLTIDQVAMACGIDWKEVLRRYKPYLTAEQLRELQARGFIIGSHGIDHSKFAWLTEDERHRQIEESTRFLQGVLGVERFTFSFPNSAAKVSNEWMQGAVSDHGRLEGFVGTGRFRANDTYIINRITMDSPATSYDDGTILDRIKGAFINHAIL